jgi:hypothetical protein
MRRLTILALVTAVPLLALDAKPAPACDWGGYGYGYSAYRYAYRPAYRYAYRPRYAYAGYYSPRLFGYRGWGYRGWGWRRGWRRW